MKVISLILWVVLILAVIFVGIPAFAPTITAKSVMYKSQVTCGDALVMMNQSEYAIGMYDNALATNASDTDVLKKKGEALIKCGRITEAGKIFSLVLVQDRNDVTALVRTGDSLSQMGNFTGALFYYDRALALQPDAKTWLKKGDIFLMMSFEEGQKLHAIAKGLSKQPGSPGYQPVSPDQLQSMDSYQKAVQAYQKAMEIDPKLSIIVSARILGATQNQVSSYQSLLNDVQS